MRKEVTGLHHYPEKDIRPHVTYPSCRCRPMLMLDSDGHLVWEHFTFDGREIIEDVFADDEFFLFGMVWLEELTPWSEMN